jgi:hypothetical protein
LPYSNDFRFLALFRNRLLAAQPAELERLVDWPVNEADLSARHQWLVDQADFRERMKVDPDFYNVKVAAWWVWGLSAWIGSGWCDLSRVTPARQLPDVGNGGRGVHRKNGTGGLHALSARLRRTRVACGDWSRVTGDSVTWRHGLTGVFLDPPYSEGADNLYGAGHDKSLSAEVRAWAIEAGKHPKMRVALAGYEGEHELPKGWRVASWKAKGGYGSQRQDGSNDNARRERIWFSPACLGSAQADLFGSVG